MSDITGYILHHLHRRHLTPSQRATAKVAAEQLRQRGGEHGPAATFALTREPPGLMAEHGMKENQ